MHLNTENRKSIKIQNRRVHMANERTFLAWIRTSISIMVFGFVVEKFALFVKQMSFFLNGSGINGGNVESVPHGKGFSSVLGIILVGIGALMGVLAFIRYKKVEKQIDEDTYETSLILDVLLAFAILAVGVFLIIYLAHSI